MAQQSPSASRMPIWTGIVAGSLAGLADGGLHLIVTVPIGFLLGYLFYSRDRALRENRQLQAGLDELLERVAILEFTQKRTSRDLAASSADEAVRQEPIDAPKPVEPAAEAPKTAFRQTGADRSSAMPPAPRERARVQETREPIARRSVPLPPPGPSVVEQAVTAVRTWLLGGNTVARVGLLVLFVGVAFLLRYVAERTRIPIELRLVGVALGALALLVFGWRLRSRRAGFAITLQGGAIGILYLTVFAALRLYDVIAPVPAFALLAVLAVLSGFLSVAQDARALAALGAAGGFLAPVLVSTGAGRVELLFSYYLLLNLGVLGIAWFRAWRELNWIAFAFTFGVMGLWAVQRYLPTQYPIGQAFLIAFWMLFLVISLLYALRQPQSSRGIFDTTLAFALPLAGFGIQSRLTDGVDLALAALVAAAAYFASSSLLIKRRDAALQLLVEANFGIGVAFLTLAVPLAASAQWTAAAWSLEGLALLWVGMRQHRALPIAAGLLLQIAGAVALGHAIAVGDVSTAPSFSGLTLNLGVLAACAFAGSKILERAVAARESFGASGVVVTDQLPWALSLVGWGWVAALVWQPLPYPWYVPAWCALALVLYAVDRRGATATPSTEWVAAVALTVLALLATEARAGLADGLITPENATTLLRLAVVVTAVTGALLCFAGGAVRRMAAAVLLTAGALVWLIAILAETHARLDDRLAVAQLVLLAVALTSAMLTWLGRRLKWDWPLKLSWAYFVAHLVLAGTVVVLATSGAQLPSRHFGGIVWPLAWACYYARLAWEERLSLRVPVPTLVHVGGVWLLTAMIAAEAALRLDAITGDGWFFAAWGAVPAVALWLVTQFALRWPMRSAPYAYAEVAAPGLAAFSLAWIVVAGVLTAGDPAPLPYLPVLNPMDLASGLVLMAVLRWHLADQRLKWQRPARLAFGAFAFIALNAAALRSVHFLGGVAWDATSLGRSLLVQSVLSLLWTASAMALMIVAHRRATRGLWLAGAGLLAAVVVKLFFVDLSGQGTIERIVSFVGVGVLILVIGYLAPVPPAAGAPARRLA